MSISTPMSHFEREIAQQPGVLRTLLQHPTPKHVGEALRAAPPKQVLTLARGSSDNAVMFFSYLVGTTLGYAVASVPPSLVTIYRAPLNPTDALVVGVSQSGESQDVVAALKALAATGATTLAVSNHEGSSLEQAADFAVSLGVGTEQAVAASKTFTAQMMALALVVAEWADDDELRNALLRVPDALEQLLQDTSAIDAAAVRLTHAEQIDVLGRGLAFGPAQEIALKLKETTYIHAHAYSSAEFQHGPIASLGSGEPVLLLGMDDVSSATTLEAAVKLKTTGAHLMVMASNQDLLSQASTPIPLPPETSPVVQAFLHVVAGQWLALRMAQERGLDPDAPRHLNKVTQTL